MKKSILSLAIAVMALSASAQISKGTIFVSGASNLTFTSFDKDAGDYSFFYSDIRGGYFLADNLNVGLYLGYVKFSDDDSQTGYGIYVRYHFNGKPFLGAGFRSISTDIFTDTEVPIELGYPFFAGKVVAFEPTLSYSLYSGDADGSAFGFRIGISVYLGRSAE